MRNLLVLAAIASLPAFAAIAPVPAAAMTPAPLVLEATNPSIVDVAVNCGRHAHYVRGHKDGHGHFIKGRCIRDRH